MLAFQPYELEHRDVINTYVKAYPHMCSELTFTNMIMWGQDGKIQWAEEDEVLYIKLKFGQHPTFFFPPVPKDIQGDYVKAVEVAKEYFRAIGEPPRFRSVNGVFVSLFETHCKEFVLSEDRNTFDYVYLAEDLMHLSGKKYHAKRNHIHQFTAQHAFEYRELSSTNADECMELYMSWLEDKDVNEPGILGEMKAIRFLLPNMEKLGVSAGGIYVNDKLVAFSVGEQVRSDLAVIHIEKADASFMGLYAVINQQFVLHKWNSVKHINREEDMGIPGMRKAKLSYKPAMLIEKYDAVLRP